MKREKVGFANLENFVENSEKHWTETKKWMCKTLWRMWITVCKWKLCITLCKQKKAEKKVEKKRFWDLAADGFCMGSSNLTKNVCKDGKTPKIRGTKKMRLYMAYYMEVLRISKGFGEIGWRLRKSVVWLSPLKMKKRCCRRIYRSRSGSFPSQYANVAQSVEQLIRKNQVCDSKSEYANVAQSVEQLIRNQQVVCSSHIISSRKQRKSNDFRCFHNF